MEKFLEIVKIVATISGATISVITLTGLIIKPIRKKIISKLTSLAHTNELQHVKKELAQFKEEQQKSNQDINEAINKINDMLIDLRESNRENEGDRLRDALFNCGNRCRRKMPLYLEEFRYIQKVGDKYLHKMHENSIGEDEYNFIKEYFYSPYNQDLIEKK